MPTRRAADAGEAALGQAAVKEGEERPFDLRAPEAESGGEAVVIDLLEGLEVLLGKAVEG